MYIRNFCILCILLVVAVSHAAPCSAGQEGAQTGINTIPVAKNKAAVIIYTQSTCPHCREAKEYFTRNNIPFVNREVDTDSDHMDSLMEIYEKMGVPYEKRGVPLILIGESIKIQGFKKEKVEEALKKVRQK